MDKQQQEKLTGVFGLGQSGISAARYLQRMKKKFFVCDTRLSPPGEDVLKELSHCVQVYLGDIPQWQLNSAEMIIISPGVSPELNCIQQAVSRGVNVVGDIDIFARKTKANIVAITGSNGKSTVTDLTHQLLVAAGVNAKIGGNFGVPVLDYLPLDDADIYVLELSSFQLDTTDWLEADVAVVLNVTEDHMDRYPNFKAYHRSKLRVHREAKKSLVNGDDDRTQFGGKNRAERFSLEDRSAKYHLQSEQSDYWFVADKKKLLRTRELKITGRHNWSNLLASIAILGELNVEFSEPVIQVLKQYQGLPHRFQLVKNDAEVDWVNDSKATNVGATQAALDSVDKSYYSCVVLIAGGDAKGADLSPLKSALMRKVTHMVLIGKDAQLFAALVERDKISFAEDMPDAVNRAQSFIDEYAKKSTRSLVLLSPACASLDMYKNFEVRGDAFAQAVGICA